MPDPRDHRPGGHYFKVDSVPSLVERFGLRIGEPLAGGWKP